MQNLVVQSLAMRQLGRLNLHQLLAAGYGMKPTKWCPRSIHTRQLWGCSTFPAFGAHRPTAHIRDSLRSWSVQHLRSKSSKKKGTARVTQEAEEEVKEEEQSDYEEEVNEDNEVKDYKEVERYVPSFRYDIIMKAGLDVTNKKFEDAFYSNKLRLNGQKLFKKSKSVKVGDTLDMVLSENQDKNTVALMRVVFTKVFEETSNKGRYKVVLRRWKHKELPIDEAFKP